MFWFGFLVSVLANIRNTKLCQQINIGGWPSFGNGYQSYVVAISICSYASL
jgi:hypothetical protein